MKPKLKTKKQVEKEAREAAFYADYIKYASNPEQSKVELMKSLMKTYNIKSTGTYYAMLKRTQSKYNA